MHPRLHGNPGFRTKWSHRHPVHRHGVRAFNGIVSRVPFKLKYGVGTRIRRMKPPYCFVEDGSVVVQVGAPSDTLHAGRSRAMSFALLTRPRGTVVVVEPDPGSVQKFRALADRQGLSHVIVHQVGAWSNPGCLELSVDDNHPATNFTTRCAEYGAEELRRFRTVTIEADTIDNILELDKIQQVDVLSITTNGAEKEILKGATRAMKRGITYIALAQTGPNLIELMESYGYSIISYDDRGYTFSRTR